MKKRSLLSVVVSCIMLIFMMTVNVFADAPNITPVNDLIGNPLYNIYINPTENGAVVCPMSATEEGDEVALYVTAYEGYVLENIEAHYGMGGNVTLTKFDGGYKFIMPAADVVINATFSEKLPEINAYINSSHQLIYSSVSGADHYCLEIGDDVYTGEYAFNLYSICEAAGLPNATYPLVLYACDSSNNIISSVAALSYTYIKSGSVNCTVKYQTQVQTYGWQAMVEDGNVSGTVGKAKRLEAIKISVENDGYLSGDIEYRTHVQKEGWHNWVKNGALSGTVGKSLRLEAIQIRLTGILAENFSVYYRVQAEKIGWLGWARDGQSAGTAGFGLRLEAIQIKVVPKDYFGMAYPPVNCCDIKDTDKMEFYNKNTLAGVTYRTQVQSYGWQNWVSNGATSGTVGKAKRLEAIEIKLTGVSGVNYVSYRTHVQTYGWQDYVSDGATSGTVGKAKRLEAIQIKLNGYIEGAYDIYYRVQAEKFGWLGWTKNDGVAGTSGYGYRLEAIQIQLVRKELPLNVYGITTGGTAYYKK